MTDLIVSVSDICTDDADLNYQLDKMNCWRKVEAAKNTMHRLKMSMLYSKAVLMMPTTWRMSHAL